MTTQSKPGTADYDLAYAIVEQMGLGFEFRNCSCDQLPCARLRPIVDALRQREQEVRAETITDEQITRVIMAPENAAWFSQYLIEYSTAKGRFQQRLEEVRAEERERAARLAEMMAAGESYGTGRQKAINIAAAIRRDNAAQEGE